MTDFNLGGRVVHIADSHIRKCKSRDHGTVRGLGEKSWPEHPQVKVLVARVDWDDGGKTNGPRANLFACTCDSAIIK